MASNRVHPIGFDSDVDVLDAPVPGVPVLKKTVQFTDIEAQVDGVDVNPDFEGQRVPSGERPTFSPTIRDAWSGSDNGSEAMSQQQCSQSSKYSAAHWVIREVDEVLELTTQHPKP